MIFTEPTSSEIHGLALQVARVNELASELGLPALSETERDLPTLQAILDSGTLDASDTHDLQSLGVAFGRVLISTVDGLAWAMVHDEYGSDPTLRYRNTPLCINVLTTISNRVEDGEPVDIAELFIGMQDLLRESLLEVGGTA